MRKLTILLTCLILISIKGYSQCVNANFSLGDFTNWVGSTGENSSGYYTNEVVGIVAGTPNSPPSDPGRQTIMNAPGTDPNTNNLLSVLPPGGTSSCRLGNDLAAQCLGTNAQAERLEYTINVTATNCIFTYQYAVVLQDPSGSHTQAECPKFAIFVKNAADSVVDPVCGVYQVTASGSLPGFQYCAPASTVCDNSVNVAWKDWTSVGIDLSPYIGQNITVEFTTKDCSLTGHFGYAYIACYCGNLQLAQQCNGTNSTVCAPAGFASYLWSSGQTTQCVTYNFPPYNMGDTVTCTATSVQGCVVYLETVLSNDAPVFDIDSADICLGQSATLTITGSSGATYNWSTGQTGTSITVTPTATTIYTVTALSPGGCSETEETQVVVGTSPNATLSTTDVTCFGGTNGQASVTPTGLTYEWSTTPPQYTSSVNNLSAGITYYVTVSNSSGCDSVISFSLSQPTAVQANITNMTPTLCYGSSDGTLTVTASGGTAGYTYAWCNGNSGITATGLLAGSCSVTVTDANGCSTVASGTVTQPTQVSPVITNVDSVHCFGECNGSAQASASGGTGAPYTYSWSNSQTGPSASALCAGTYTVTATDGNGCTNTAMASVYEPLQLITTLDNHFDSLLCYGDSNGYATINVQGGTFPWQFEWNTNPPQYTMTANDLPAGIYTLTVTDANGCTATHMVNVYQPAKLGVQVDSLNVECSYLCDGQATSAVTGGTLPWIYEWYDTGGLIDTSNLTLMNLCPGYYLLIITDANGCIEYDTTIVGIDITVNASFTATPVTGNVPLPVNFTYTGSSSPTNVYYWDFGDGYVSSAENPTHTYTEADTFTVMLIVTDGTCTDTSYFIVYPELPSLLIVPNVFTPNGDGVNDQFWFTYESIGKFHCIIFNRWGKLIYEWDDITHGWDGSMTNGAEASDGVYYYILEASGYDDVVYDQHGTVTLIR